MWVVPLALGGLLGVRLALGQSQLPSAWVSALGLMSVLLGAWALARLLRWIRSRSSTINYFPLTASPQGLNFQALWPSFALLLLSLFAGYFQTSLRASWQAQQVLDDSLENRTVLVQGVITSLPDRTAAGWRFRFEPTDSNQNLPNAIWVNWSTGFSNQSKVPEIKAAQRWRLPLRLRQPYGEMNPHAFDSELWMWERGLGATASVIDRSESKTQRLDDASWTSPAHAMLKLRQSLRDAIEIKLGDTPHAGVIAALTLGDQASIDRDDWDLFRITGVAHLMAISGVHVTAFAWLTSQLMLVVWPRLRTKRYALALLLPSPQVAGIAGCLSAFVYACFAGFELPAQRTVWMLCLFVGLRHFARQWPWVHVWLLVAWWVVMWDPMALLQAGFWLSFVAVGILFSAGSTASPSQLGAFHLPPQLKSMLREQWLMSVCLAPLSIVLFAQISIVGLLANLIAVPWVTFVITPLSMLGVIWHPLWLAAAKALQGLVWLLTPMSQWPLAYWQFAVPSAFWSAVALAAMALWAMRLPIWLKAMSLIWVMPMLTWSPSRVPQGEFELWAADIGQGQAIVIRTATSVILYDSGPTLGRQDAAQKILIPLMKKMGWQPDALLLSHTDNDHSGGVVTLLNTYPDLQRIGSVAPDHELQQTHDFMPCEAGMYWQIDGVNFEVLHPSFEDLNTSKKTNAMSCVIRLSSASQRVALLTGDIEAAQEKALLEREDNLRADWLQVPHHGSRTSSTPAFIDAVRPRFAIIQAGYLNRFGHPRAEILTRYKEMRSEVVQTPQCGASLWASHQPNVVRCERLINKRFWHRSF